MPFSSVLGASSVIKPGVCTSSTRPSVPYEGQLIYETDTDRVASWNGSAWVYTATGGLITVKGETAFSNVANVTADGVFTSAYTNYRMIIRFQISVGQLSFQLRAATVDATTNYSTQSIVANGATLSGARTTSTSNANIGNNGNGAFWGLAVVELSGPQLAEPTLYQSQFLRQDGNYTTATVIQNYYGNHSDSTSYDGIKLLGTSANITGSYTIYGYAKV